MDKVVIARGTLIRNKNGGYARVVEDGVLGESVYVRKYTVFRVSTINLYTQTVIVTVESTGKVLSLEYDFILKNCEIASHDKSTVVNGMAIVDINKEVDFEIQRLLYIVIGLLGTILLLTIVLAANSFS